MRFEQLRTLVDSLRFRLTAWNTAVVLMIVLLVLLGVREGLRLTLVHEVDDLLLDDTLEVALAVEQFYPELNQTFQEMNRKVVGHSDRELFAQLLDANGVPLWSSRNMPDLDGVPLPAAKRPSLRAVGNFRLAQRRFTHPGLPEYTIRVGSSLRMVDEDVSRLTKLMLLAGGVILLFAPLSGFWLSGRATRPLARIITTAGRLRPSHMEERLPIRGTGDELDKLSLTINRFLDLIGDYLDRNREFVANAAHELRSPLAAIQSSVDVTLNSERSIQEYQDLMYEISEECGQLGSLVNQLLLLAETDTRFQVQKLPVAIDKLVERSLDMFRGAAEEGGIQLTGNCAPNLIVYGDNDRLRQVVNNLIDNSLKFTTRGGSVYIKLWSDDERSQVVLSVSDTGIGIDPADLPHVFERFYRGDKSRQREKAAHGNGLGLSICQSIVEAHAGSIQATGAPGKGATFTVRLPAARPDSTAEPEPPLLTHVPQVS